ncbi:MAG: NAD(P)-dependent oxidoreductase [Pusillimonas sp.]
MATILVTGGAGFIGAYVCRRLVQDGYDVVVHDIAPSGNVLDMISESWGMSGLKRIQGDLRDASVLANELSKNVEAIVHLASPLVDDVESDPREGLDQIIRSTCNVFDAALKAKVPKVIWASSLAVFGRHAGDCLTPISNDQEHRSTSLYGAAKSLCERASERYRAKGLDTIGLRFTFVYGAGRLRGRASYPSHLIRNAALGNEVVVPFSDQLLNWQYVDDLADLVGTLIAHPVMSLHPAYNVNGDTRTLRDAGKAIERALSGSVQGFEPGVDVNYRTTPMVLDDSCLRAEFNWEPKHDMEAGITASIAMYQEMQRRMADVSSGAEE